MNRSHLTIIIGVALIVLARTASAQSSAVKPTDPPVNRADNSSAKAEVDLDRSGRREQARQLLFSLSIEARSFREGALRARSLARIADALWGASDEQARTLFREAWEAAEKADRESQQPLNLRGLVLRLAANHDRVLAEEFLQKQKSDQHDPRVEISGNNSPSGQNLWELSEALEQRLSLAENLLSTGEVERALQFADPALSGVTISTMDFLTRLREKAPAAADQRYAALVANTGVNTLADANTISVLSSYIFTPHTYVIFHTDGSADTSSMPTTFPAASVRPELRLAFFQTSASVLLRPQSPEHNRSRAGIAGKFMLLKRLMPLFEQYAPKEITDAMRGQFEALKTLVNDGLRQSEDESVRKGITPEKQVQADREHALLDQIEHAKTSDERNELYFQLALLALAKDDMKAREYVSKIDEIEFRKRAQAWVDPSLAISAIKKKKVEAALELVRIAELTHIQRLWILTQSANLLAKTDRDKAMASIDEATAEARRIEGSDRDRPRGLLAIANALILIQPSQAWDSVSDAVKAANSTEGFTGENGGLTLRVSSKSLISRKAEAVPDFDIQGIFGKLANDDYNRAVDLARSFQAEAPRINATIAIARAVLNKKSAPVRTPQPVTKN